MSKSFKELTEYLRGFGIDELPHTGTKTYLGHLVSVYRDLEKWKCEEDVCLSGMFHSIYGTELFQGFKLPLEKRSEIRELVGDRAEKMVYWNCAMDRASFDAAVQQGNAPHTFTDRFTGETTELPEKDFDDLVTMHLCDWLEQVPRYGRWDYRRAGYRSMAERMGGIALESFDKVFALEPAE